MLAPENILDSVEDTGYKLRKSASNRRGKLHLSCLFPNELLLGTSTSDGGLQIQDLNSRCVLLTLELHLMGSNTPGKNSSSAVSHRVNRAWSNILALYNRMIVFTLHLSNQILLASLSNEHAEVLGDQVCLLGSHDTPITTLCVDEKRSVLISGDSSGKIRLWPLSWDALQTEKDQSVRWRPRPLPQAPIQAHSDRVTSICFNNAASRSSDKFVSCGGDLGVVNVWQLMPDHQSVGASMVQRLECGHGYFPSTLAAHDNLCAMGTECGKIFVWDHEELELLMVAEEVEGVDCLSIHSSVEHPNMCVCGNKSGSVRVFRPNDELGNDWQLMAECYLGARLLLNEVNEKGCLVLLAGRDNSYDDTQEMVCKQWHISSLPSSPPPTPQERYPVPPQPRPNPPPLPTPKFNSPPPPSYNKVQTQVSRTVEEPDILDVVGVDDESDDASDGESIEIEETNQSQREEMWSETQHNKPKVVGAADGWNVNESPYKSTSILSSAGLNSTAKAKQLYVQAQQEKFTRNDGGRDISEEGLKHAARMRNVPLADQSRYSNLEKLNPTIPAPPKRLIKKQIDPKWEHQVKAYGLEPHDMYLPDWQDRDTDTFELRSSGKKLLEKMKKGGAYLETDPLWRLQRSLTLDTAAACFDPDVKGPSTATTR